ncbi:hypothetical protein SAMN05880501_113120 [Ureibacillus xyleni]|uniref:DUF7669 domain-containing protein n=1 Tax=Ureibacillus xyleni TaxID=614648 RepID=A0A285TNB5_9BACL|nr:hypothetical protein [Ureibacillus xyleni]SOC22056.1 hypothetical protein SAMN05880501_113120 [Ureibacillus xyleni]
MSFHSQTCREQLLSATKVIIHAKGKNEFTIVEVLDYLNQHGSHFKESTIRTHITSKCCINAPNHHAETFNDYIRINRGKYALLLEK